MKLPPSSSPSGLKHSSSIVLYIYELLGERTENKDSEPNSHRHPPTPNMFSTPLEVVEQFWCRYCTITLLSPPPPPPSWRRQRSFLGVWEQTLRNVTDVCFQPPKATESGRFVGFIHMKSEAAPRGYRHQYQNILSGRPCLLFFFGLMSHQRGT